MAARIGCSVNARRSFDPRPYRIVLFDRRGSGRSTPHAGLAGVDLATDTTPHLLADIERLRRHPGIERWQDSCRRSVQRQRPTRFGSPKAL
jgi:proline iminopeptidase